MQTSPIFKVIVALLAVATSASAEDFVTRQDSHFIVDNQPFYYAGANSFYLSYFHQDENYRPMVDEVMSEAQSMGLSVMRTWAFNDGGANRDGYPTSWALQTSPGVYNEDAFIGLDYVLYRAQTLGMRVTLTLVNNWDDYGGLNWYNSFTPTATSHDDFYTDPVTRQWYKDHVTAVLNRTNTFTGEVYKNDPTIFAWELGNELRAESDPSGDKLFQWLDEMSAFVKSQDPNHLVTTGLEGFYSDRGPEWFNNGFTGSDFIRDHSLPNIDYATLHLYPDFWAWNLDQTLAWLQQHIDDADALNKPLVLGEFGKSLPLADREAWFQAYYDVILAAASQAKAMAGSNVWMLEADASGHDDGFGIYNPDDASTIALISAHAAEMNALNTIPEPGAAGLLGVGLGLLFLSTRSRAAVL
jgi:mannan endo-1,4-beta-mannosidase